MKLKKKKILYKILVTEFSKSNIFELLESGNRVSL